MRGAWSASGVQCARQAAQARTLHGYRVEGRGVGKAERVMSGSRAAGLPLGCTPKPCALSDQTEYTQAGGRGVGGGWWDVGAHSLSARRYPRRHGPSPCANPLSRRSPNARSGRGTRSEPRPSVSLTRRQPHAPSSSTPRYTVRAFRQAAESPRRMVAAQGWHGGEGGAAAAPMCCCVLSLQSHISRRLLLRQ